MFVCGRTQGPKVTRSDSDSMIIDIVVPVQNKVRPRGKRNLTLLTFHLKTEVIILNEESRNKTT